MERVLRLLRDAVTAADDLIDRTVGYDVHLGMLAGGVFVGAIVLAISVRRSNSVGSAGARRVAQLGVAVAVSLIVLITLSPGDFPANAANLTPGASFERYLRNHDLDAAVRNLAFNVLLFVPYGLARGLQFRGRGGRLTWLRITSEAMVFSAAIEAIQHYAPLGRVTDVDDVILNTIGGFLGAMAALVVVNAQERLVGPLPADQDGRRTSER